MNESLTAEKILNALLSNEMTKGEASERIISLIENNDDPTIRIKCIEAFDKIDLRSEKVFKILGQELAFCQPSIISPKTLIALLIVLSSLMV